MSAFLFSPVLVASLCSVQLFRLPGRKEDLDYVIVSAAEEFPWSLRPDPGRSWYKDMAVKDFGCVLN